MKDYTTAGITFDIAEEEVNDTTLAVIITLPIVSDDQWYEEQDTVHISFDVAMWFYPSVTKVTHIRYDAIKGCEHELTKANLDRVYHVTGLHKAVIDAATEIIQEMYS
jgi:hypothetical protein